MKKIILICFAALFAIFLTGCVSVNFSPGAVVGVVGSGTPESFEWSVGEITEIRVELGCNVEFFSAPSDVVTLEIQPNLVEYIEIQESGGVLTVRSTRTISTRGVFPVLTVSSANLNGFSLAGAGAFTSHDTIVSDSFSLRLDGAGSGRVDFDVGELSIRMSGAGKLDLGGKADVADFTLSGTGSIEALSLQTRIASVDISGVGSVRVSCSETLRIFANGVGTVEYRGSPSIDLNRGGLVTVRKVD